MRADLLIRGAGGGGKGGGGSGGVSESPNTLRSSQKALVLDAWCEGPIVGLANGAQSVFLDKTPLQNADGSWNFNGFVFEYATGTPGAVGVTNAAGYAGSDAQNTISVHAKVYQATPVVQAITAANVNALRVSIMTPALTDTDAKSGNIGGTSVAFQIALNTNGGGFVTVVGDSFNGKTTSQYTRDYLIPLTGTGPWEVQVTRLTPDSGSSLLANDLYFDALTLVSNASLAYPHTAMAAIAIDAMQFDHIPARAYDVRGLIVQVPSNYDPATRSYTGTWDGTFQLAWTDNPAWCFYDLLTNERYGLGGLIDASSIDKWSLYTISQYCDQMVPDGFGGLESRFTCNLLLASQQDAYAAVQHMASIFRAIVYWGAGTLHVSQDAPADPVMIFSPANVAGGAFSYQGTSLRARHTVAQVTWNDPDNGYASVVEYVQDDALVAKYGVITAQVRALGCTRRGQAHRLGKWLLYSESLQTETVTFRCAMDGMYLAPGDVIQTSDPTRAGVRMGGRMLDVSADLLTLTLDAAPPAASGLSAQVLLPDGSLATQAVAGVTGNQIVLAAALPQTPVPGALVLLSDAQVQPELWQVVTLTEANATQIDVAAVAYNASKYAFVEDGLALTTPATSLIAAVPAAPSNLNLLVSRYVIDIGVAGLRGTVSWSASGACRYRVVWNKANAPATTIMTDQHSVDIESLEIGVPYTFTVTAFSAVGQVSPAATLSVTPAPAPPPTIADVAGLQAAVQSNGVLLSWTDVADPMRYDYEIREGVDWVSGTLVGFYAGTSAHVPPLPQTQYDWWIKARNLLLVESVNATPASLSVTAPQAPGVTASLSGDHYVLGWTLPASMFPVDHYVIATGAQAASARVIANNKTTQYQSKVDWAGTQTFWIAAVDAAGNQGAWAMAQLVVTPPAAPTLSAQVIDNNVLLSWTDATATLPVVTYQVRRGPAAGTFDAAQIIGTQAGLFTTVFETSAGTYRYWVAAVDSAGNVGTPGAVAAAVNAPPDYVLHADIFSTFAGTLTNAVLDEGAITLPVDTASTWAQHFSARSWNAPQDQIAAGLPIYAQPALAAGSYEEVIDYGAVLSATNVQVTPTTTVVAGTPALSITVSSSNVGPTGPWTDYAGANVYLTDFRWVKVLLTVTAPDATSLLEISRLEIKLSVKLKNDAGTVLANAADANGTAVAFNVPFVDVTSITVTPAGTSPLVALYDFSGQANPSGFSVYLFTPAGQRSSGAVSWAAKGY